MEHTVYSRRKNKVSIISFSLLDCSRRFLFLGPSIGLQKIEGETNETNRN